MRFYDQLADSYDDMTRFDERFPRERQMLRRWQEKLQFHSALDVACGTGLHAISLASLGVTVAGVDASRKMIRKAQENARRFGADVPFHHGTMEDLPAVITIPYDIILCLGNSIPHLLNKKDLIRSLQHFYSLLTENGHLLVQLLNYAPILKLNKRIVGVHRIGNREFIRFYDFLPDHLQFNVLQIVEKNGRLHSKLVSTSLHPYKSDELEAGLRQVGFSSIFYYGDMHFAPFNPGHSPNLVILAKKR